ncbi:MAG: Holliday junction resolvase RuvX [Chitinispirillia bacterium]|nr:Holliday junction resolvase RuvX [Chitinispirillia bacterium]MCL2268815.1 Holliday junction resolvase RuvX [Chitinispirillia bacterium]
MSTGTKFMGIDYGRRRIGVAVSDDEGLIARGLCVIDRQKTTDCVGELLRIIDNDKPSALVFGLPLGGDDGETVMSREVREFASLITDKSNLPIHFIDESFTSQKAAALMMHRKKKARRDKSLSDRIAACLILQDFIDTKP